MEVQTAISYGLLDRIRSEIAIQTIQSKLDIATTQTEVKTETQTGIQTDKVISNTSGMQTDPPVVSPGIVI